MFQKLFLIISFLIFSFNQFSFSQPNDKSRLEQYCYKKQLKINYAKYNIKGDLIEIDLSNNTKIHYIDLKSFKHLTALILSFNSLKRIKYYDLPNSVNKITFIGEWKETTKHKKKPKIKPVNINKADREELTSLPTIGLKSAENIIKYRKKNGEFFFKDDIMNVPGIGISKFNKMKDYIRLGNIDLENRKKNIKNWTMKNFIDIGFKPSLSLRLVLFIQNKKQFRKLEDLLNVHGMNESKLKLIKQKLEKFK